eukprot:403376945
MQNENQENMQHKVNYQTPNKRNNIQRQEMGSKQTQLNNQQLNSQQISGVAKVEMQKQMHENQIVRTSEMQLNQQQKVLCQETSINNALKQKKSSNQEQSSQSTKKQSTRIQIKLDEQQLKKYANLPNNLIDQTLSGSNQSSLNSDQNLSDKNLKTLLKNQKQYTTNTNQNMSNEQCKRLHQNQQSQLQVQGDSKNVKVSGNSNKQISNQSYQKEYQIEQDFDSAIDDEEYGDENINEQEIIQSAFHQQNSSSNAKKPANINQNYYYDEVEATQYSQNIQNSNQSIQQQIQYQQKQLEMRNFSSNKSSQLYSSTQNGLVKDIQQISIETLLQNDEQIQADIKFCLYCIYNNYDLQQYFMQLLRVQRRLKEWSFQLNPNILFSIFEENIKEFMFGIRDRLIEEMKQLQMIRQKVYTRRYSLDDYFLIDKTFSRSYSLQGYNNDIFTYQMQYMNDPKYETKRNDLRHKIWSQVRMNNETIVSFYQYPDAYQKIFDLLIKFYTRVRDSIIGIEEMWVFFMESIFHQELKGNMIFEQYHKQIFKKDILNHRDIERFLKEIHETQLEMENRRQNKVVNQLDPIIENISSILIDLDEDLNFQYPEEEDSQQDANQQVQESNPEQLNINVATTEEQLQEEEAADFSDTDLIITYQQLSERVKKQYGGMTLAQQVEQQSTKSSNYKDIIHQINQGKRVQELMDNLQKLDSDTLCYIIENSLTQDDYEKIIQQNQHKLGRPIMKDIIQHISDDFIISPSKDVNFLCNYLSQNDDQLQDDNDTYSNEEEDDEFKTLKQMEKKKRKNLKKKKKRKEKKIMAQHQNQLEEMLKLKLLEEQQRRGFGNEEIRNQLRKKLIDSLGLDPYQSHLQIPKSNTKLSQSVSKYHSFSSSNQNDELCINFQDTSQNDFHTKQTQCDEYSDIDPVQEIEFEKDLEQFRQRLESNSNNQTQRKKAKLRPNITTQWIEKLKQRLDSFYQCQSPKQQSSNQFEYGGLQAEGLWMKSYQRSA